ncbi:putative phage-type endonuclease domain protein [Lysobacter antibioticus]|uniref:lambda exonuclease family protein n=1 Tax=Lysobacter antibioticus TaxID=84531 RepID=UPI00071700B5|nr:lambda exonuclease family protein [Lysobacter antibioticus]ALN65923.1 putative phage-type endonuclease domain protein [Lysobacter antibioticus]
MKQRSEAWYKARAGRITGSRFARAMASKHSSTYRSLIDELVQERRTGRSLDGGYMNAAMQWGMDHENNARQWYGRSRGCHVAEAGFVVHPEHDFVGISPDGLVADDGLIEIKCPQIKTFRQVMDTRQMPSRYRWQVQGQLWVCRRQWLDFVCFYPPGQGIVIRIFQDQRDFDQLDVRCREVNREVERRVGPWLPATTITPAITRWPPPPPRQEAPILPKAWVSRSSEGPRMTGSRSMPGWAWLLLTMVGLGLLRALLR